MTMHGSTRSKRKQHAAPLPERPQKLHRAVNGKESVGENTPDLGSSSPIDEMEMEMEEDDGDRVGIWQATIEEVVRNVVSIRFCQTCAFDTDPALTGEATGVVVDAERGYILTNRHVVGSGPFWGYVVFDNHEEAIKYMPVAALELRPDLAKVGAEIRVVGNDAGEKLSILSGVISRLDRNAPEYGEGYSDFNTNYIQAAAAASGGSSGSPVVNIDGFAVALQAGEASGRRRDRLLSACVEAEASAGVLAAGPADHKRNDSVSMDAEAAKIRAEFPKETGMLVAEIVLPEGPSDTKLEEGDILLKVNGELLTQFVRLDDILDSNVGQGVKLVIQRGSEDIEVELAVGDLHKITPDRFISVAGASLHELAQQEVRLYAVACKGVFICEATGSFKFEGTDSGWLVQSVDHKKTPDLATFIEVMKGIPDRSRVVVTYKHLRDLHTLNTSILYIDRHWSSKMRLAVRNDNTGLWDFSDLAEALPALPPVPRSASFIQLDNPTHPAAAELVKSFVRVACHMPVKLDGFPRNRKWGMGVVLDAEKGLVIISRAVVPYDFCDISITIADSIIVDGKVVFMHPLQNYAIIKYDPSLVDAPVKSAKLSTEQIKQGASTYFIGFNQNMRIVVAQTTVTDITAVAIPANAGAPRYLAVHRDAITVDTSLSGQCGRGVLVAEDGTVHALWLTYLGERSSTTNKDSDYHLGMATPTLLPVIKQIQAGVTPELRMLSVEFNAIQMSQARIMGVSESWIKNVAAANSAHHQLFMVRKRTFERDQDSHALQEGDVILTLNGNIVTRVSELDVMYDSKVLDAVIVRDCVEMHVAVPTVAAHDVETDRAVNFCGAVLHRPHLAVRQQISKLHSEVYVSARTRGSPAYQYGLAPTNFITAVNGVATPDLESFIREVVRIPDNTYFRLKCMTFDNVPWICTMKKNEHYFATMEWIKDPSEECGWRRISYEHGESIKGEGKEGINEIAAESIAEDDTGAGDTEPVAVKA
ncbi:hypothetical protein VE04_00602 [Pseudogymnoascus sp. 24MN13]|nr:hypothetical protein VE04_00602 [Pseudogymnoascus sp. 24MN13]